MDSKDQNLDLTRTKWIHFCPFQSIFVYWEVQKRSYFCFLLINDIQILTSILLLIWGRFPHFHCLIYIGRNESIVRWELDSWLQLGAATCSNPALRPAWLCGAHRRVPRVKSPHWSSLHACQRYSANTNAYSWNEKARSRRLFMREIYLNALQMIPQGGLIIFFS